ncbi:MAG: hypothetical protein QM734_09785 [Cyclobacteriaceae bacterium]
MKKSLLLSTIVLLIVVASCNKTGDNAAPSNNQKVLGMVLQTASQSNSGNLILLKDGRTINPISGFSPANLRAGNEV